MEHSKSNTPRGGPSLISDNTAALSSNKLIYDSVPLNLPRRDTHDSTDIRAKPLNCKRYSKIATINVRSIKSNAKQEELALNCRKQSISILGIVDHKLVHDNDELLHKRIDDRYLITSSAWRNSMNAPIGGLGLLIDKGAENNLAEISKFHERILIATFNGNPALTIVVHYAPVEGSEFAEDHYNNLADAVRSVPKHHLLLVMGDFNAHIGKDVSKFSFHDVTNSNGKLLTDLIQETNLEVTNGRFQKKKGKMWTYVSDMSGTKSQIDYILVNKKWRNSIHDCRAYNTFSSIGSDHRIVSAKVKLSLRKRTTPPTGNNYDWSALKNTNLSFQYTISVCNRFNALSQEGENATEAYRNFITANDEAAKKLIPKKEKSKKKRISNDPRVASVREKIQKSSEKYFKAPTDKNREVVNKLKEKLNQTYDDIYKEELDILVRKVESSNEHCRHRESWRLVNDISGRKTPKSAIIKAKSKEERIEKWYTHFKDLLGNEPKVTESTTFVVNPVLHNLNILDTPFTPEEYTAVKKEIKCGKACGPDGIPPEVLKFCDLDSIILQFINKLFFGEKPEQWSESILKPLPKSGDLSLTDNYRGIALSPIAAKLANRLILNRIRPSIDPLLRPHQNGFRPGRSTVSHILALRRIIEGVKEFNLKAVLVFVDFKKAFDSIHRDRMFQILKSYDIPESLIQAIKLMYSNTKAKVLTPDGETSFFDIVAGVLQGDTLAPFLFAIVLDYVMRQTLHDKDQIGLKLDRKRSRRHQPIVITDTDFADDIALISEEIAQAQELLSSLEKEAGKVGLHLNSKKTEFMKFNIDDDVNLVALDGKSLKCVNNFKYLGGWLESSKKDFEVRKALSWVALNKLSKIWKSNLCKKIRVRLFVATIESILLYGSETWTFDQSLRKRLDGCYTKMLRVALNVTWKDKLTNIQLYGDLPPVSCKVAERRMRLAGHCVRHPNEEVAGHLVLWQPKHGHRKQGRRSKNYIDTLLDDTGLSSAEELKTAMLDRESWRTRVDVMRVDTRPK